jgi:hypothetical protein
MRTWTSPRHAGLTVAQWRSTSTWIVLRPRLLLCTEQPKETTGACTLPLHDAISLDHTNTTVLTLLPARSDIKYQVHSEG